MTDREKKQREILEDLVESVNREAHKLDGMSMPNVKAIDQAISKLDAIPTSKEVEEAVYNIEMEISLHDQAKKSPTMFGIGRIKRSLQTLIQAVKLKEEAGVEEIADKIFDKLPKFWWKQGTNKTIQIPHPIMLETAKSLAKSLLTKYSIRRRG